MRRYLCLIASLVFLLAVPCLAQDANDGLDPSVLRMLAPNSSFVLGIQWRKALGTSLGEQLKQQLSGPSTMPAIPGMADVEKTLLEDVDSLYLASTARDIPTAGKNAPILAIIKGRFDRENLKGLLQGRTEIYRRVALVTPENVKPPTTRVALLDDNTILFGDRLEMIGALDRLAAPPAPQAPSRMFARVSALAARHDLWLIAEIPPARPKPGAAPKDPSAQIFSQLSGVEVGLTFSQGFDLQASLRARSAEGAQSVASTLQGLLALGTMSKDANTDTLDLLRKIRINQEPRAVKVSLTLTQAEVQKFVQQAEAAQRSAPAASDRTSPATTSVPQTREPPRSGTIRIIGGDSGPVEIPIGK